MNTESKQIAEIKITDIHQIENARAEYRESELSELMTSMKQIGLLQAIGVKAVSKSRFEVVFGNRRFLAAKKLGWQTIPAVMTTADSEEEFLLKNTTENIVRAGVPLSEQGRIFHRLTTLGLTSSEISSRIGISTAMVANALELFRRIPKKYHDKIITGSRVGSAGGGKKGQIGMTAAKTIQTAVRDFELKKEDTEQLYELATKDGISVPTLAAVSKLVGQGYKLQDAVIRSTSVRPIKLTCLITKKEIERVESKYKMGIIKFLHTILEDDGRVKLTTRMGE